MGGALGWAKSLDLERIDGPSVIKPNVRFRALRLNRGEGLILAFSTCPNEQSGQSEADALEPSSRSGAIVRFCRPCSVQTQIVLPLLSETCPAPARVGRPSCTHSSNSTSAVERWRC